MQVFHFHREHIPQVNTQHLNLVYNQEVFLPYIEQTFSLEHFEKQIDLKEKSYSNANRQVLSNALVNQYKNVSENDEILKNIELLKKENTFTVTTGHQLSLFTGPMYFVVKILHVIKLTEALKVKYPEQNFIPVYWMASEDHDFEEIQSMNLFNRKFTWESAQVGPVGRFKLDGLEKVKEDIREMFKNHPGAEINDLLDAYDGENLTEATRNLVHFLFKKFGLIIIDGDDAQLKRLFIPIAKKELERSFSYNEVSKTNHKLEKDGAKIQVHAREINLFYLLDGLRNRIIKKDNLFEIEGVGTFSLSELLTELEQYPERFSPNVILRPLYQELILPNLAYIGGVGEISYWLQLKGVFDAVKCTYPLIGVRNSVVWVDSSTSSKMKKINLKLADIFKSKDQLKKTYVKQNDNGTLDFSLLEERINEAKSELNKLVLGVDPKMEGFAIAESKKLDKQLETLKSKLIKVSKSKHDTALKQIDQIIDKLFPASSLQERVSNFFTFSPDGQFSSRIDKMYSKLDPVQNDLLILREIDFK